VRRYLAGRAVIGQRLGYTELDTTIVGVVADARVTNVKEDAVPLAFFPLRQRPLPATSIDVRTQVPPESLVEPVRAVLARAAPTLTIERVVPLTRLVHGNLGQERLVLMLTSSYGILALGLAGFGVFSTLSYTVSRRRNELGIRMALGAAPQRVLWGVLTEALVLAAVGIAIGLPLVMGTSSLLRNMLFGVTPYDWPTVTGTVAVLGLVAILAGILPAWRASRLDPLTALRVD
jgi:predicted lysophospholipase L1 biosynthesis ABC-type transport system permease subunit